MDLFGAPVHYVTGDRRDKVTLDLAWVANQLSILRDTGGARPVPENGARTLFGEMYDRLKSVACLLKPMSDSPDDYRNLDESEWRILYYPNEQERIRFLGDDSIPPAKITFEPADLEIIVFPNNETRTMALSSIMGWFGEPPDLPIMVTVAECLNF